MDWQYAADQLSDHLDVFEERPGQHEMMTAVAAALRSRTDLVVEAGTGTGKTLAYLIPLLAAGRRALVSTATRALQRQIVERDLAIAMRATGTEPRVAVLKGRRNYLCRERLGRTVLGYRGRGQPLTATLIVLEEAARRTVDGDVADITGIGEDDPIWPDVTSTADNCLGSDCPQWSDCFVVRARRRALAADLIIANHHLLLADFAVRDRFDGALLLPDVEAIVIDEAHQLEDVVAGFFGLTLSDRRIVALAHDVQALAGASGDRDRDGALRQYAEEVLFAGDALFGRLRARGEGALVDRRLQAECRDDVDLLDATLAALARTLRTWMPPDDAAWPAMIDATATLRADLQRLLRTDPFDLPPGDDEVADEAPIDEFELGQDDDAPLTNQVPMVRWIEVHRRHTAVQARPIEVAPILRRTLLATSAVRIFTSATLQVGGRFDHFADRLGMKQPTVLTVPSPFDFATQAMLYLPSDLPEPGAPKRDQGVAEVMRSLAMVAGGGAFLLFTSHRAMQDAWRRFGGKLPMRTLLQGEEPRERLLERFRTDQPAVLFATIGFWQGVDMPGDDLRLVVLDKVPFPPPDDPLFRARAERLEASGQSSFARLSIPIATTLLRQGFGRLIRGQGDRGVVAILDPRLLRRPYGKRMLAALPPVPRTSEMAQVAAFFAEVDASHRE